MNYLGINRKEITTVVSQLNKLLANYSVYYQNLRNFHWNIQGIHFFELHRHFEDLYNDAKIKIDDTAERILTLRLRPISKMSEYIKIAEVAESEIIEDDREMVQVLLENHKVIIKNLRNVIEEADKAGDEGTIDMAASFLEELEKKSWMLDAWATKATVGTAGQ
ncbi:MAG: Dps family protein [Saprospiraceae bacterium]